MVPTSAIRCFTTNRKRFAGIANPTTGAVTADVDNFKAEQAEAECATIVTEVITPVLPGPLGTAPTQLDMQSLKVLLKTPNGGESLTGTIVCDGYYLAIDKDMKPTWLTGAHPTALWRFDFVGTTDMTFNNVEFQRYLAMKDATTLDIDVFSCPTSTPAHHAWTLSSKKVTTAPRKNWFTLQQKYTTNDNTQWLKKPAAQLATLTNDDADAATCRFGKLFKMVCPKINTKLMTSETSCNSFESRQTSGSSQSLVDQLNSNVGAIRCEPDPTANPPVPPFYVTQGDIDNEATGESSLSLKALWRFDWNARTPQAQDKDPVPCSSLQLTGNPFPGATPAFLNFEAKTKQSLAGTKTDWSLQRDNPLFVDEKVQFKSFEAKKFLKCGTKAGEKLTMDAKGTDFSIWKLFGGETCTWQSNTACNGEQISIANVDKLNCIRICRKTMDCACATYGGNPLFPCVLNSKALTQVRASPGYKSVQMTQCEAAGTVQNTAVPTPFLTNQFEQLTFAGPSLAVGDKVIPTVPLPTASTAGGELWTGTEQLAVDNRHVLIEFIGLGGGFLAYNGETLGVELNPSTLSKWTLKWLGHGPSSRVSLTKDPENALTCPLPATAAVTAPTDSDRWPFLYNLKRTHPLTSLTLKNRDLVVSDSTTELGNSWRFLWTPAVNSAAAGWVLQNAQSGLFLKHPANGALQITNDKQKAAYISIWTETKAA